MLPAGDKHEGKAKAKAREGKGREGKDRGTEERRNGFSSFAAFLRVEVPFTQSAFQKFGRG